MHYYKAKITYAGTQYAGFQWQNSIPTIQDEFNKAVASIVNGKITTTAASRTDTGVHAIEQIVRITSVNHINCQNFIEHINNILPHDIRCLRINPCEGSFRPAKDALSKEYRYLFTNNARHSRKDNQYISNISNTLNMEDITFCVSKLIGTHNFHNFYSKGSNVKSTERNIIQCTFSEINPHIFFQNNSLFSIPVSLKHCYQLQIIANGYLKQMIRHIISALWMVGSGKISTHDFLSLLQERKDKRQLWKVAPPNGLYLYKINY